MTLTVDDHHHDDDVIDTLFLVHVGHIKMLSIFCHLEQVQVLFSMTSSMNMVETGKDQLQLQIWPIY